MPGQDSIQDMDSSSNDSPEELENDIYRVELRLPDRETLGRLLSNGSLDFGPIQALPNGDLLVDLFLNRDQITGLKESGWSLQVFENLSLNGRARQKEVGQGDRFEGGKTVPKGMGKKIRGDN